MKPNAFSKREHILSPLDFDAAYRFRKSARDATLKLCVRPNGLGFSRLGLSVSRRFGNSVRRNRFRRICREAFRLHKRELPVGYDIVVIPTATRDVSLVEAVTSLLALAKKLCQEQA